MVEPPPAVARRPILRAIAPPGEVAVGRRDGCGPGRPVVRCCSRSKRFDLDRRMADDVEQRLMVPNVAFERRDIEIADDRSRLSQLFGPAGHAFDEVELLAELGIEVRSGMSPPAGNIDILKPDAAVEPGADMARLAVVLPVVAAAVVQRKTRQRMATP